MATLRGLGAVAILAWVSTSIAAFFVWQGVVSIVTVGMLAVATYETLPKADHTGRFSLAAVRGVGRFAGGMVGITFLTLLLTQVDKILLSKLLTLRDYGYYALAAVVAGALFLLVGPIAQAWYPRLSELHARNDQAGLIEAYHQGAQLSTVVMGSAAIVMITFAETVLHLWTQDDELVHHTATLVRVLALGNLFNGLLWMPYQAQLAHGWTGLAVRFNIAAVVIIVPAILWATPRYGPEAAAWIWVCLNAGYMLLGPHLMHRQILAGVKWRWYAEDILMPICGAASTAILLKWLVPAAPHTTVAQIAILAFVTSVTLAAATAMAPAVRSQIKSYIIQHLSPR
jgi:O-antigen/teichoic acid export membrane protein